MENAAEADPPIARPPFPQNEPSHKSTAPSAPPAPATGSSNNLSTKIPGEHSIYRGGSLPNRSLPAVVPQGRIFALIPRLVQKPHSAHNQPLSAIETRHRKPKFVPFEPYKAAISPLVSLVPTTHHRSQHRPAQSTAPSSSGGRNNLDVNTLVQHISINATLQTTAGAAVATAPTELDRVRADYERQLAEVRRERDSYAAQLKSQVLVNTELKHLLVAAVGEDLQTHVNVLTEDKLHLARALLSTAENLSSHTEQIEYLAGQSEVWRSKFLASSLMVEELARWKAALQATNRQLADGAGELLATVATVRGLALQTLTNLQFVDRRCVQQQLARMRTANVLDVSAECLDISQQLVLHSEVGGMPREMDVRRLERTTPAERAMLAALQASASAGGCGGEGGGAAAAAAVGGRPLLQSDEPFRAVVGQAFPANGKRNPSLPTEGEAGRLGGLKE